MKKLIIEDIKKGNTSVRPFSSGSEAMNWKCNNCDECVKNYFFRHPDKLEHEFDFDDSLKIVSDGLECAGKLSIDLGFITGEISQSASDWIFGNDVGGDCIHFSDDENDNTENETPIPPNQLLLPFHIMDLFDFSEDVHITKHSIFSSELVA